MSSGDTAPAFTDDEEPRISREDAPNVFLDCSASCDRTYIRTEITFVNYVRDREASDVHVLITAQRTGSGSREFELDFIGRNEFEGLNQELFFIAQQVNTPDETRAGLTRILKIGLVAYVAQTPLAEQLAVEFDDTDVVQETEIADPWNFWVFDVDGNGSLDSESLRDSYRFGGSVSADRVTELWRVRSRVNGNYDLRRFENDDETIESAESRWGGWGSVVKSLGDHWSAGVSGSFESSTRNNTDFRSGLGPAIEYSVFPYSEVSRRELTIAYRVGVNYWDYTEVTIFDKVEETQVRQSLEAALRVRQPWGNANIALEGSTFFSDLGKSRLEFRSFISLRVVKGLSVRFSGGFELINDQLFLPKGDASLEEILLQRRQLATNFGLNSSIGLSYTFGSIYNNVVNTRL
ncbi:MAG: hypothetical protein AAGJ10_18135 [Bacteroidota bacterium]